MKTIKTQFIFKHVTVEDKDLIINWLAQSHIGEWLHGVGLQNLLKNLDRFFENNSESTHWIAYSQNTPFAYLLTTPEGPDAISLDLFISDTDFIGKGLSVPLIQSFLLDHFSHIKEIFIDPEASNTRAIHVYQKAGFQIIGEFIASWHPVPHYKMKLDMNILSNLTI